MNTNEHSSPTRLAIILTVVVTLLLVIGSAILGRIVFKADALSTNVYFKPVSTIVKRGDQTKVDVLTYFTAPTDLIGAQLAVKFDSNILQLVDQSAGPNWQVVKSTLANGIVTVVETPTSLTRQSLSSGQPATLITLTFQALAEGSSSLQLMPAATIVATEFNHTVSNSVATVQDGAITVGGQVSSTPSTVDSQSHIRANANTQSQNNDYNSQRIIDDQTILAPNAAMVLVSLQQPAAISVRFGLDKAMVNSVKQLVPSRQIAVRINGLEPGIRYYYQVVAKTNGETNQTLGQIKSFMLPQMSDQTQVDHANLTIFPATTNISSTAYAVLYDAGGNIISGLNPKFSSNNPILQIGSLSQESGLYQVPLTAAVTTQKQAFEITLALNGKLWSNSTFVYDPSANKIVKPKLLAPLSSDQKTIDLIFSLLGALIIFGTAFFSLCRTR